MSDSNIMSVRELIDTAFGDPDNNVVNHKHIQTILYILARQLRVLERRVEVVIGSSLPTATSSKLNITEVKMHTMQKKKGKGTKDAESKAKSSGKATDDKTSPSTSRKMGQSRDKSKQTSQDSDNLLDTVEEKREKVLRVIHQRADSHEEQDKSPTPIASLDSVEAKYEKLLVVERIPSVEAKTIVAGSRGIKEGHGARSDARTPRLSIVTQDQFEELSATVRDLQAFHAPIATPGFPDNAQLMADLRKGASLTDAMAALQLSARLESAEKALEQMLSLVTELARQTPGIDLEVLLGEVDASASSKDKAPADVSGKLENALKKSQKATSIMTTSQNIIKQRTTDSIEITQLEEFPVEVIDETTIKNRITKPDLNTALQKMYDDIIKHVTMITSSSTANAENAFQKVSKLEVKVEASLELGNKMNNLEMLVTDYADQINMLDTGLSSQMTNYQEQLTQMQHDLEIALETMAEALANTGGDVAAIAELNGQYNNLQLDIDNTAHIQKNLKDTQITLSMDLQALWKQIELLREIKSDRDEVADALRDKVGIGELNGLVALQYFDAVRGDFENRICAAYDKFNSQELVWQKAIDELMRTLNEKCDSIYVASLKDEIEMHLNKLKSRMHAMMDIIGEPRAAALTRQIHRDAACISCTTPAFMNLEEPGIVPALPQFRASRPPKMDVEAKPNEDGDHGICYPGFQIPQPKHPRTHVCSRYCGGSHTLLPNVISRVPPGVIISQAIRQTTTEQGSDKKMYMTDNFISRKPCSPCNDPKTTFPEQFEQEKVPVKTVDSDMTPDDFVPIANFPFEPKGSASVTPPPPNDYD